ncbi:hypothetical protein GQ44DRAFT_768697 [Phaeosphaeriaceae sp. PMI808]|nr:hypothetical protein GQ44DRAFT_768697 [Phaeosphaeriaceae sp. PMI808]
MCSSEEKNPDNLRLKAEEYDIKNNIKAIDNATCRKTVDAGNDKSGHRRRRRRRRLSTPVHNPIFPYPTAMTLLRALSLGLLLIFISIAFAQDTIPSVCRDIQTSEETACAQPIGDAVTVTPGSFYTAKVRCYNCSYEDKSRGVKEGTSQVLFGDIDLLFDIQLSDDNRTVFLNKQPFFPTLPTIPTPPTISVPQLRPDFTYRNLSFALECGLEPSCRANESNRKLPSSCVAEWCYELQLDVIPIDYLYTTKRTDYQDDSANEEAIYWEFAIDAIGTYNGYWNNPESAFDNPAQKMVKVVVEGIELTKGNHRGEKDMQAASSLFGPFGEEEKIYNYRIVDVSLVQREFDFPARKTPSFAKKISNFFGNGVWEEEGRLVYIRREWDAYGKEGTLRNMFGYVTHWWAWFIVWYTIGSTVAAVIVIFSMIKLYFWVQEQRVLMSWDGMDDVWDKLRREREEEDSALLGGDYRDDPEDGGSSRPARYTDDLDIMKPLPIKPLPEKPLPDVPLIDA